jgi:hypothetical protein
MRIPTYLFRLIGFTFCLGAIPLLILGMISYRISSDELVAKAKQTQLQQLTQTKSEVKNLLAKLDLNNAGHAKAGGIVPDGGASNGSPA